MKRISRIVDIATLLVFLFALTSNCLQASLVTLDSADDSAPVFSDLNAANASQFDFPLADDESDDTANLVLVQSAISPIEAVRSLRNFSTVFVVAVTLKQPTVLRI
jgi:hypothetical protein